MSAVVLTPRQVLTRVGKDAHAKRDVAYLVQDRQREVALLATLAHPHLLRCHGCGEAALGRPFAVLDLVEGTVMDALRLREPKPSAKRDAARRWPAAERLRLCCELADALACGSAWDSCSLDARRGGAVRTKWTPSTRIEAGRPQVPAHERAARVLGGAPGRET